MPAHTQATNPRLSAIQIFHQRATCAKVDSIAEPVLLICAAYVAFDGLTIVLCGALKGCGRQMLQVAPVEPVDGVQPQEMG